MSTGFRRVVVVLLAGVLLLAGATSAAYAWGGNSKDNRMADEHSDQSKVLSDKDNAGIGASHLVTLTITKVSGDSVTVDAGNGRTFTISATGLGIMNGNTVASRMLVAGDKIVLRIDRESLRTVEITLVRVQLNGSAKVSSALKMPAVRDREDARIGASHLVTLAITKVSGDAVTIDAGNGRTFTISATGLSMLSGNAMFADHMLVSGDKIVLRVERESFRTVEITFVKVEANGAAQSPSATASATPTPSSAVQGATATPAATPTPAASPSAAASLNAGQLGFKLVVGRIVKVSGNVVTVLEFNGTVKVIDISSSTSIDGLNSGVNGGNGTMGASPSPMASASAAANLPANAADLVVGRVILASGNASTGTFMATDVKVVRSILTGTVTAVNGNTFSVKELGSGLMAGKTVTVNVDQNTLFFELNNSNPALSNVTLGSNIAAFGFFGGNGVMGANGAMSSASPSASTSASLTFNAFFVAVTPAHQVFNGLGGFFGLGLRTPAVVTQPAAPSASATP